MYDDLRLPEYRAKEDIYFLVGDLFTVAIEHFVSRNEFPDTYFSELGVLSKILEELSSRNSDSSLEAKKARLVSGILAIHLGYMHEHSVVSSESLYQSLIQDIFTLLDESVFSIGESLELLEEIFPLFSPLCVSMCLANASAVIFPRLCQTADRAMVDHISTLYGISSLHGESPAENLRALHPFYLVLVHRETSQIIEKFAALMREVLLPRKDGSYSSVSHYIFTFYEEMTRRAESLQPIDDASAVYIDPSLTVEEQDHQYFEYVNHCAKGMMQAVMEFDNFLSSLPHNESSNFEPLMVQIRGTQDTILSLMRNMFVAGEDVYQMGSIISSVQNLIPEILKEDTITSEVKDILVCFLPGGLFSFEEAKSFWERRACIKRDLYLSSMKRLFLRIKNLLSSDDIESKREMNFLMLETDTPLRSLAMLGIIEYDTVISSLFSDVQKVETCSAMEYQAALQSYLIGSDEEFYSKMKVLL